MNDDSTHNKIYALEWTYPDNWSGDTGEIVIHSSYISLSHWGCFIL